MFTSMQNKKEAMIKRQHEDVLQVLERQVVKILFYTFFR